MRTIAAVCHDAKEPFSIEAVELPEIGPGEVLVRVVATGLCHTDLAARDGNLGTPFPSILGHEGAGIVESVGAGVLKVTPGDHVVLSPMFDGTCAQCQRGAPMYCESIPALNFMAEPIGPAATLDGGATARIKFFGQSSFARHAISSERNTIKVPKEVPLELLGPLGCGIQTGAGTVINGLKPAAGSSIAVLGTGAVGLAAVLASVVCGCAEIIAVDRVASRLKTARSLGATNTIDTSHGHDLAEALREIVPAGVDYLIDSAGVANLITQSIGGLAKLGTLALVAVPPSPDRVLELPWFGLLLNGQKVQGFVEGDSVPDIFINRMIDLYRQGRFPFDKLIRTYDFDQLNQAVDDAVRGSTIKAVLVMPGD